MNLVCTCLKFTHTGDIKVSATATHSTAHVVVAYTGEGLTAPQLQQALNPFEYVSILDLIQFCKILCSVVFFLSLAPLLFVM